MITLPRAFLVLTAATTIGVPCAVGESPVSTMVGPPVSAEISSLIATAEEGHEKSPVDEPRVMLGATNLSQGVHFDSIDSIECCGGSTVVPSDPDIAASAEHIVVVVNLSLEIYDTTGTSLVGPLELKTMFSPLGGVCSTNPFYPVVLFDEAAGRFILGADGDGSSFCVAVSHTADPTGAWWYYGFPTNVGGEFFDWPQVGIGRDALYLGATLFGVGTGRVWAIDKAAMYTGSATTVVTRDLGGYLRPQPLNLHGAGYGMWPQSGPHYFLSLADPPDPGSFELHSWAEPFGTNSFSTHGVIDVGAAHGISVGDPIPFPQLGGAWLEAAPNTFKDFEFHDSSGWTTNHVSCNPGGGTVDCIQWAEIDLASATIVQAGVFSDVGIYRTYPDLAVNACGDMAVGYTRSSTSIFPGIGAAGREAADSPGTMQDELVAKDGEATYTGFSDRWGEYTGMTIDPSGQTFWYAGVYSKNNGNSSANWGTSVSSFAFPDCAIVFADGFESGNTSNWSGTAP